MQEIRIYEEQLYNWKKLQVKIRKLEVHWNVTDVIMYAITPMLRSGEQSTVRVAVN
jgi:hypothetical protein